MATSASPLVLLDGHSLAYRAFFALPSDLQTTTGQLTNVVYGFTTMLVKLFGDFSPDRIAVCFDLGRPAYRHEVYDGYKANRRTTPDDFSSQMPLVREVLSALRIPVVEVAGYEADDLIATLVREAREEKLPVLVVTGDRDNLQLIDDAAEVRVMMTRRGITDTAIYDEAAVQERYGVPPGRYIDVAALRGDPSDNLPGVPGVGDKTATKLVQTYGSAEEVVAHAAEQRGKLKENLLGHGDDVLRNKQLMRLRDDVPLPVGARDLRMGAWDRAEIHRLFDTLEFHPLRERLFAAAVDTGPVDTGFEVDARRLAKGELAAWLAEVPAGRRVALAARLHTGPGTAELTGLGLCAGPGDGGETPADGGSPGREGSRESGGGAAGVHSVWVDLGDGAGPEDLEALGALLGDPERPKLAHDAKYLYLATWARGWELQGLVMDTALAAYLVLPAQRTYDLADLALRYLRKELRPEGAGTDEKPAGEGTQLALDTDGEDETWPDWCLRAQAVGELAVKLGEELAAMDGGRLIDEVELPLVPILAKLERTGIAVDLSVLDEIRDRLDSRLADHEAHVYQLAGEEFNIGSNPQLQQILFEKLRLPKTKRIKTGYTTDHNALAQLATTDPHPILDALLGYREVAKLKNTYVDALPKLVDKSTGRIHAQFNQLITSTGRLSTQNPNVQNIPIRTGTGREIRRAFVAAPEAEGLLVADYAQIEFRVLAHLAGDEALVAAFLGGEDVHATVAGMVWGLPPDQVDRELRARVKMVTYGLAYGLSAFGLAQGIGIPPDEARALMDAYFERFGKVKAYLDGVVTQARRDGYTSTILGRRRYLPDLASDSRQRRQMAERMALNAPIQGSAADIIKMAMVAVDRAATAEGLASRMVLQVHDELVFEVAPGEGDRLAELVRREMQGVYQLRVPLEVSMATGRSWAEAQH
ncbi:MAG TPA: DNA polymerase I [Actinomycetota bacterium]|nr:DNA polymerase I [Actinomycetota bacterium]